MRIDKTVLQNNVFILELCAYNTIRCGTNEEKLQNKRGFTLVELIVVLTILGVLAAMLIPALQGYIEKALETSDIVNVRAAYMQVLSDAMTGDVTAEQTVQLKQGAGRVAAL